MGNLQVSLSNDAPIEAFFGLDNPLVGRGESPSVDEDETDRSDEHGDTDSKRLPVGRRPRSLVDVRARDVLIEERTDG